jgi:hypothetical protein
MNSTAAPSATPNVTSTVLSLSLAVFCTALLSACATSAPTGNLPVAPAALKTPDTERVAFVWQAIGSQIYECRNDAGKMAWVFIAPEAELTNDKGDKVGTHGAGPSWTALDGSKTVGTVKARANGAQPADIPLLLLSAKAATGAPVGKMSAITSVQRLNTEGGNAQAKGCDTAQDAGKRSKEGYTSDYVFFTAR